ncbi:MAG: YbjN domain-containing protein [Acidimicrobiales bacterium]
MRAPIGDADAPRRVNDVLTRWRELWPTSGVIRAIEHQASPDDKGHYHWLVRLKGEEKDVMTLWFSLRQRTLHVECEVTPAPEEQREALFRYLLVRNYELRELHLAIGPEEGVYLVTQLPVSELTIERLDELVGATLVYVDEIFPTAMAMGLGPLYRRRPQRSG